MAAKSGPELIQSQEEPDASNGSPMWVQGLKGFSHPLLLSRATIRKLDGKHSIQNTAVPIWEAIHHAKARAPRWSLKKNVFTWNKNCQWWMWISHPLAHSQVAASYNQAKATIKELLLRLPHAWNEPRCLGLSLLLFQAQEQGDGLEVEQPVCYKHPCGMPVLVS